MLCFDAALGLKKVRNRLPLGLIEDYLADGLEEERTCV